MGVFAVCEEPQEGKAGWLVAENNTIALGRMDW